MALTGQFINELNSSEYFQELIDIWRKLAHRNFIKKSYEHCSILPPYEQTILITGFIYRRLIELFNNPTSNPMISLMLQFISDANGDDLIPDISGCIDYWQKGTSGSIIDDICKYKSILTTMILTPEDAINLSTIHALIQRLHANIDTLLDIRNLVNIENHGMATYDKINGTIELLHDKLGINCDPRENDDKNILIEIQFDPDDKLVPQYLYHTHENAAVNQFLWIFALMTNCENVQILLTNINLSLLNAIHDKRLLLSKETKRNVRYMWILFNMCNHLMSVLIGQYIYAMQQQRMIEIEHKLTDK